MQSSKPRTLHAFHEALNEDHARKMETAAAMTGVHSTNLEPGEENSQAVGEGTWLLSFMDYDLGDIDLEERTLQPLDNPFGPKV